MTLSKDLSQTPQRNHSAKFADALAAYVAQLNQRIREEYAANYENLVPPTANYELGNPSAKRYIRVILDRAVHSFVSIETGDVFKPASWKAPAKHARGNIYSDQNGMEAIQPGRTCVRYLS